MSNGHVGEFSIVRIFSGSIDAILKMPDVRGTLHDRSVNRSGPDDLTPADIEG